MYNILQVYTEYMYMYIYYDYMYVHVHVYTCVQYAPQKRLHSSHDCLAQRKACPDSLISCDVC